MFVVFLFLVIIFFCLHVTFTLTVNTFFSPRIKRRLHPYVLFGCFNLIYSLRPFSSLLNSATFFFLLSYIHFLLTKSCYALFLYYLTFSSCLLIYLILQLYFSNMIFVSFSRFLCYLVPCLLNSATHFFLLSSTFLVSFSLVY